VLIGVDLKREDSISILLAGRAGIYRVLQNTLGNEPTVDTLEQLGSESTKYVLSLFLDGNEVLSGAIKSLMSVVEECLHDKDLALDRLSNGFTRLFVGPGKVEADPWESYYCDKEGTILKKETLDVRKAYAAQGLLPVSYPSVSDDHIALELDFLASLAGRAEAAYETGDIEAACDALKASNSFLREHLAAWVSVFAEAVNNARHSYFYKEVAYTLSAFLPIDLDAISELLAVLESQPHEM